MLQTMRSAAKPIFYILAITFVGGFIFAESSGLLGRAPVTAGTPIAEVNGREISYAAWENTAQGLQQEEERRLGRALTGDEIQRIRQQAYDQLVGEILLDEEYARRAIDATPAEIQDAARYSPPPQLLEAPELQTEGRFDIEKYQRYLSSPQAKASGLLAQLEGYYRDQIKRAKLFDQVSSDVFVTDNRLWNVWRDTHDSAQVSYVAFHPELVPDSAVKVTDSELRSWYDAHRSGLERPGRAVVSVVSIPREITAADSAATRSRVVALRNEIVGGARFEDVARRESIDSASAAEGGALPRGPLGRYVPEFENAAKALKPGEISQPVLTRFGYHLIKLDERKGDTLALRHILLRIQQSDSTAMRTDRQADELGRLAAGSETPAKFDSAASRLDLQKVSGQVFEGETMRIGAREIPDVSAWAFSGVRVGETSELFSDDDGYYLARLDSLEEGGVPNFDDAKEMIRREVVRDKKLAILEPRARQLSQAAVGSSLEAAAQAQGLTVQQTPMFARVSSVPGLGQLTQTIGAAFALPVGSVSTPVKAPNGVFVLRVDRRTNADRAIWEAQKAQQRQQLVQALRQRRVSEYLENLRKAAKIKDHRKEVLARGRGTEQS